ncbi:MAG: DUF4252 domain-containing protein [Bacteroidota bacterium]
MKTILSLLIIGVGLLQLHAQDFSKYESMPGVTSVSINKNMFKLMSQVDIESEDDEAQEMIKMIENLRGVKVYATKEADLISLLNEDANAYKKNNQLEELMQINDDRKKVTFHYIPGKTEEVINQLFMHIDSSNEDKNESVVIIIQGNIDLSKISALVKEFNLPASDEFEKLEEKE